MSAPADPFEGIELEEEIARRAASCGITLSSRAAAGLATHARAVLARNERLHLTSITDPREFLERHIGEAFEGAALLPADAAGTLLDVGSGNGYPAIPIAAARPGLRPLLAEASEKKSAFLTEGLNRWIPGPGEVLFRQVQRAVDLEGSGPMRVITTRAVGGWAKLLPKLTPLLDPRGVVLLWAGPEVETILHRVAWRRLRLETTHPLPGRERSAVWVFGAERTTTRTPPPSAAAPTQLRE